LLPLRRCLTFGLCLRGAFIAGAHGSVIPDKRTNRSDGSNIGVAFGADRFAIGLRPAQAGEDILRFRLGHAQHLGRTERSRGGREEKMLCHLNWAI
jgi:hypothetical protein